VKVKLSSRLKNYKINNLKLIAYSILGLVAYFLLFTVVSINLRQQGVSMQTMDIWFYVGLVLILIGCSLASIEKKKSS